MSRMMILSEVPFTYKLLMCLLIQCITLSRNCTRKILLLSITVKREKLSKPLTSLNIFLDLELSLLQTRYLSQLSSKVSFCLRKVI